MTALSGLHFLKFEKKSENQLIVTRGRIGYAVGHDADTQLGAYLVSFPRADGKGVSHKALIHAATFTDPSFVLFDTEEQQLEFLAAQQRPPGAVPVNEVTEVTGNPVAEPTAG